MREYRILWLDDDFLPLISNPSEDQESINDTRETFQQDVRMLCNEGFIVDSGVLTIDSVKYSKEPND